MSIGVSIFREGSQVCYQGQQFVLTKILDLNLGLVKNLETKVSLPIKLSLLSVPEREIDPGDLPIQTDLEQVSPEDWEVAKFRYEKIKPLLDRVPRGQGLAKKIARECGVGFKTIYRWKDDFLVSGTLSGLLPVSPPGGVGKPRIKCEITEALLSDAVDAYKNPKGKHGTGQRQTFKAIHDDLIHKCVIAGVAVPAYGTLRKRIQWENPRSITAGRHGDYLASMAHDPNVGKVKDANWPLQMVQMDHTELPIQVVRDGSRKAIGRPWITLAIDVYSRVIVGMYLSLDAPSAMAAGMCMSHAILPKEKWLADRGFAEEDWPVWGLMENIHLDNAREFRGQMMRTACTEYLIDLHLRPVRKPNFGGHIERLMGTFSQELKKVPGTTYSGPTEKGGYDSEGEAIFTLKELEKWLISFIIEYNHRKHRGINDEAPINRYREGLLGSKGIPGRGIPARLPNQEKVRIDFMPFTERVVSSEGVVNEYIYYWHDVLRPWVHAKDPTNPRCSRSFKFRYDPRDMSILYFYDPNAKRYFGIPYRDLTRPPISIWEISEAKKQAKSENGGDINEEILFKYRKQRIELRETAQKETKAMRRASQKATEHKRARTERKSLLKEAQQTVDTATPPPLKISGYDPTKIEAFDDEA